MEILLKKAVLSDCKKIHQMQTIGFQDLLERYQDFDTNPGAETLKRIEQRFQNPQIDHYFVQCEAKDIGYIRIRKLDEKTYRISQLFILPIYQNNGYAQQAIRQAEALYPQAAGWILDTIKQEEKLCYLYEKMGYRLTGEKRNIKRGMDLVTYRK